MELLAVSLALLVLATPAIAIYAAWRQHNLRRQIESLTQTSSQQIDALHRELLELRRQVAALAPTTTPPVQRPEPAPQPASPAVAKPAEPVPPQVPAQTPAVPAPLQSAEVKRPSPPDQTKPTFCAWCGTVHAGGIQNCPTAKPVTQRSEGPRQSTPPSESPRDVRVPVHPSIPAEPVPPAVQKPANQPLTANKTEPPLVPASTQQASAPPVAARTSRPASPAAPTTPPPVTQTPLASKPPSLPTPPPPAAVPPTARVVEQTPIAAMHAPTPKAKSQERLKSVFTLEEAVGTKWLNKLGITLLVLGVAFFGILALEQMGPAGKVLVSFAVSFSLLGGGIFLEKRERYRIFGYTLIGGGWALLFFTTYALNHVRAMRVLDSETTDLVLMLAVALAMVAHTLRYRSQLVTGLAFLLAYTTVSLSHDSVYSLAAGVILAIGLVSIVIKMGWFELEVFGILSAFLTHLHWLYGLLGPEGAQGQAFPEYHASTALLLFYWLTFRISYVVRKVKSPGDEHVSTGAALLNTLLLLATMRFQSVQPELTFTALLVIGAAEFIFGQIPITRKRREAFIVLSILGATLMIAAVPFRYSGNNVAILWLIGGEALLAAGVTVGEVVFSRLGLLTGLLVGGHLFFVDLAQLMAVRRISEDPVLNAGVMFALCACVFYINSLFIGVRWQQFFTDSPDFQLITLHSYLGVFAASSTAWALCTRDWTAVALAAITLMLAALGHKLKSFHLQVQFGFVGVLALFRVVLVNFHSEVSSDKHILMRLLTVPAVAAMFYATAKWAQLRNDANQRTLRGVFALAGTGLITGLIYFEVPELWHPVAAIVFAVALLEIGQFLPYHALAGHAHILSGLAVVAALTTGEAGSWYSVPLKALAAAPVVAGVYWIARRIDAPNPDHVRLARIAYTWAGTGLMLWVLDEAVSAHWVAVSWIIFAVALALVMRRIGYRQLAWQANVVAACSVWSTCFRNLPLERTLLPGISLRLVTVSIVAAGLYFLSRKAVINDSQAGRAITYLHTFAATGLLVLLAWYEAPGAWVAPVWAIFALVLALVDRRFELEDIAWQIHALALLTMLRGVSVNLYVSETWHAVSVRLLSLAVVTVVLYALCRVIRMPQEWRTREIHHIYSWGASALVSLLMWYELQPLSVAVGWGVFGLVLFEYGLLRGVRQFRFQAYVALSAAFGRIFFANLTAGNPGEFWGPRIYTVLPLTLIFFFVYAQLETEAAAAEDRRRRFADLLGYIGTGSVVAVLYFQFANDWLVTAWAVTVFALFGLALLLNRPIFLHQGILLTIGTCLRGVMHNLFGPSYFSGGSWTGRYFVLGSAVAVLLACLPFAFRMREQDKADILRIRWMGALVRHPEQFMFFAPLLLLTLMLTLKMRAGMVTVAWGIEGVLIILLALAVNERSYRLTGLILLLVCVAKIVLRDAWGLTPRDRYVTFIILGAALLLVSFLYTRYRETIRQFL